MKLTRTERLNCGKHSVMRLGARTVIGAVLACGALLLLASCGGILMSESVNPRVTWQAFFGYVSDGDFDSAFALTSEPFVSGSDNVSGTDAELNGAFLHRLSESCDYQFVSDTDAHGFRAWQTIDITAPDMRQMAVRSVEKAVADAKVNAYKYGSYKTDEQIAAAVRSYLLDYLANGVYDDCMITSRVRVEFRYKDRQWHIVMNDELYDAISGYSRYVNDAIETYLSSTQSTNPESSSDQ